jgi:hypothetical protein
MLWSVLQFRRLLCLLAVVLSTVVLPASTMASTTVFSNSAVGRFVAGSLDDWLALGMALLAALFCMQKREQ